MSERSKNRGGWFPSASAPGIDAWFAAVFPKKKLNKNSNTMPFSSDYYNLDFAFASNHLSLCEGAASPLPPKEQQVSQQQQQESMAEFRRKLGDDEPPCSTCRYTGMAVCAGLSLHFLRLATEETTAETTAKATAMAKNASKKSHKAFFYGGALVWASAGVYRSMMD
jgi:hypothetical protein